MSNEPSKAAMEAAIAVRDALTPDDGPVHMLSSKSIARIIDNRMAPAPCADEVHAAAVAYADAAFSAEAVPRLKDYRAAKKAAEPGLRERLVDSLSDGMDRPAVEVRPYIDWIMPIIEAHIESAVSTQARTREVDS